ncbi:hypothetical protein BLNAU_5924 [Blattamonas nauphoetae]|uniref:Uncharacterized protein n=1 Tax=Blattamonas nauphoetae TaxID=2049346 RepID=A0ABQ9Y5Y4_9EUKA|nr:hypothetical protein BLNAU_5924 [Blattamonas nauphoetae]
MSGSSSTAFSQWLEKKKKVQQGSNPTSQSSTRSSSPGLNQEKNDLQEQLIKISQQIQPNSEDYHSQPYDHYLPPNTHDDSIPSSQPVNHTPGIDIQPTESILPQQNSIDHSSQFVTNSIEYERDPSNFPSHGIIQSEPIPQSHDPSKTRTVRAKDPLTSPNVAFAHTHATQSPSDTVNSLTFRSHSSPRSATRNSRENQTFMHSTARSGEYTLSSAPQSPSSLMRGMTNTRTSSFASPLRPAPPPEPIKKVDPISPSAYFRLMKPKPPMNPRLPREEAEVEIQNPTLPDNPRDYPEPLTITHPKPFHFATEKRSNWRGQLHELKRQRDEQRRRESEEHHEFDTDRWNSTFKSRGSPSPTRKKFDDQSYPLSPHLDEEIAEILSASLTPSHRRSNSGLAGALSCPIPSQKAQSEPFKSAPKSQPDPPRGRSRTRPQSANSPASLRSRSRSTSSKRSSSQKRRAVDFNSFYERMMKKQKEKEEELARLKAELEGGKLDDPDCVFKPAINKQKKPKQASSSDLPPTPKPKIEDRLLLWNDQRRKEQMDRARTNADLPPDCTFKPKLNKKVPSFDIPPRADPDPHSQPPLSARETKAGRDGDDEQPRFSSTRRSLVGQSPRRERAVSQGMFSHPPAFTESTPATFKPTISTSRVRDKNTMEYLAMPAFERLSKLVRVKTPRDIAMGEDGLRKEEERMAGEENDTTQPTKKKRLSDAEFRAFLQRQEDTWTSHQTKAMLAAEAKEEENKPKLKLCQKSLRIAEERNAGMTFLERVEEKTERDKRNAVLNPRTNEKVNVSVSLGLREQLEKEKSAITFSPQINKRSQQLKGRGFEELSTGEIQKRKEKMSMLLREKRKEEQSQMPFKPKLSSKEIGVESKLGVLRDPDHLLQRLNEERLEKERKLIEKYGTPESREEEEMKKRQNSSEIHNTSQVIHSRPPTPRKPEKPNPRSSYALLHSSTHH